MKDYLTISEAAELIGKSKETLRRWDKEGILNAMREPGSKYRVYKRSDIYSFMGNLINNEIPVEKSNFTKPDREYSVLELFAAGRATDQCRLALQANSQNPIKGHRQAEIDSHIKLGQTPQLITGKSRHVLKLRSLASCHRSHQAQPRPAIEQAQQSLAHATGGTVDHHAYRFVRCHLLSKSISRAWPRPAKSIPCRTRVQAQAQADHEPVDFDAFTDTPNPCTT